MAEERFLGKGYVVPDGYMGWVPEKGKYILFASEDDYRECVIFPALESSSSDDED